MIRRSRRRRVRRRRRLPATKDVWNDMRRAETLTVEALRKLDQAIVLAGKNARESEYAKNASIALGKAIRQVRAAHGILADAAPRLYRQRG